MKGYLDPFQKLVTTEEAREWLAKALNPTDPTIGAIGMPDGTASDTVAIELTTTQVIGASQLGIALDAPWGGKVLLTPHMYPGSFIADGDAAAAAPVTFRYPLFTGSTPLLDYSKLYAVAEAWRLCAQSVTIHLDANSTKDSGTIVAAQMVTKPIAFFPGMSNAGNIQMPLVTWQEGSVQHTDNPGYTQLMALPRAYQSNLRTGLYMPLKLSSTSQHWMGMRESCLHTASDSLTGTAFGSQLSTASPGAHAFPFYAFPGPSRSAANNDITGTVTEPMMGDNWGHIAIAGVDPSSSLVFKFRTVLEMKVQASSSYAPHMRPAPFPDHRAIDNYFTIVRQLPDAYPADFNDAGKIMGVIGKAIKTVTPFLNYVPGVGKTLTAMADPISRILVDTGKRTTEARRAYKAAGGKGSKKQQRRAVMAAVLPGTAQQVMKTTADTGLRYKLQMK